MAVCGVVPVAALVPVFPSIVHMPPDHPTTDFLREKKYLHFGEKVQDECLLADRQDTPSRTLTPTLTVFGKKNQMQSDGQSHGLGT